MRASPLKDGRLGKTLSRGSDLRLVLLILERGASLPAHHANGSLESPLSMRDSASAESDASSLTIIGLPGGGPTARRINIGLVNVGEIPATFRISVRSRSGAQSGRALEEGLAEDESFQVTDIERKLGATIDENDVVDITMIAGTCVAYATVVGADGSNQMIAAVPSPKS